MSVPTRVVRPLHDSFVITPNEFDSMVNRLFHGEEAVASRYPVDVREDADSLHIDVDLPGFCKDQVNILLENSTLTISAQPTAAKENEGYLIRERRAMPLQRSFKLPRTIDDQSCDAKLKDGMLQITLKKREETKPRKIAIS